MIRNSERRSRVIATALIISALSVFGLLASSNRAGAHDSCCSLNECTYASKCYSPGACAGGKVCGETCSWYGSC